ncbi:two component, sigma54 specific, transcriptional regulator, Fis family [Desulfocicer vacuolatum DSM 3385]|uniref:Two component, sigma54 specific, transcriptional regulator, Fis family n=1 Tax=Desulfocicer vacuolatum DSM 3385 TaxID=1121400 RepID=A0A1W2EHA0_9BACT|nr:sigma-54 dependent transcriptional regulator [Desulfocicer vacuolatum]SMD08822.1 two component, sigma54 specific, transcriptional regulator, Fis family [Desulfocicer vacuolatum DSM 3385]
MNDAKILVVDDEPAIVSGCEMILSEQGYHVETCLSGREGLKKLQTVPFDLVLLDIKFPNINGIDILKILKQKNIQVTAVIMTGKGTIENAVEAMKSGAFDFITKPFGEEQLLEVITKALESLTLIKENENLKKQLYDKFDFNNIIGHTPEIQKLFEKIQRVAPLDSTVLLNGESGTGKELFAHAIHEKSNRSKELFLAVDCSTLASTIMESELFGHVKGAFTGADANKQGIFETTSRGTLFLDEIASLDMDIQGKLLRVLETGEYKPVGSSRIKKTAARMVAATNRDLGKMVEKKIFREDLFYRLNVFPLHIPPLRERRKDIPEIAYHFLKIFSRKAHKKIHGFSDDALSALVNFDWPGNVRQLKNVVERLVIMCDAQELNYQSLMDNFQTDSQPAECSSIPTNLEELKIAKKSLLKDRFGPIERSFLRQALDAAEGNISQAARSVGMQRSNFSAMMKKHGIRF